MRITIRIVETCSEPELMICFGKHESRVYSTVDSRTVFISVPKTQALIEALQRAVAPFLPSAVEPEMTQAPYRPMIMDENA